MKPDLSFLHSRVRFGGGAAVLAFLCMALCITAFRDSRVAVGAARVTKAVTDSVDAPADPWPFEKYYSAGAEPKVSSRLRHLIKQIAGRGRSKEAILASRPSLLTSRLQRVTDGGMIQCYVIYCDAPDAAVAAIANVGGIVELVCEPMGLVQAQVPYDQVGVLAADSAIKRVRLPGYHRARTGSVTSQGDAVLRCDLVRSTWGLTGAAIKVGVISDGINGIGASQASGNIPTSYQAQSARADGNLYAGAEGLALMEIIYDLAPGANLAFSNPNTSAEMINAIDIVGSTFQSNVLCDDIAFPDEPFFQDGPIVTRIDQAVSNGAIYCSAADNEADQNYYEGDFAGIAQTIGGQSLTVQDLNGAGDWNMQAVAPAHGGSVTVILQWNDPWGASGNDYDLYLTDSTGATIYDASTDRQNGSSDPLEMVQYTNTSFRDVNVYVEVSQFSGIARHLKIVLWGEGYFTEYYTGTGSIYGHPAATNVISCGAVPASSPETIEPYSGRGPVRIDFPSLVYRNKPDLCGTDGVSVTGNGGFATPFYGTSAATPHVAGVCALSWSFDPGMAKSAVRDLLQATAVDLGPPGYDMTYGYGRVDALNAASALEHCAPTIAVAASPASAGTVSGGGSYPCSANATVTAVPNAGFTFVNWTKSGAEVSSSASYEFTVSGNVTLVANFVPLYTLTVEAAGNPNTVQTYAAGTSATVSAPPAPSGELFSYWSGDASGTDDPIMIVMDGDKAIVANYEACPVQPALCGPGAPVCGLGTLVWLGFSKQRSRRRGAMMRRRRRPRC